MSERQYHTFSVDAPECQVCQNYNDCKHKRRVLCKWMEPLTNPAEAVLTQSLSAPVLNPHEYRDVKISTSTTVTIDLVELKKKMQDDFYKALNCGFLGGAT